MNPSKQITTKIYYLWYNEEDRVNVCGVWINLPSILIYCMDKYRQSQFFFVPGTGLCDVSLADRILCVSELDPSITPSKLHDIKLCIKKM